MGSIHYKTGSEIFWLKQVIETKPGNCLIDLGCGDGSLLRLFVNNVKNLETYGIEVQENLYKQAKKLLPFATILLADIKHIQSYFEEGLFDIVICNPPFYKVNSGKISLSYEKAVAKHEILVDMSDILKAASFLLKDSGKLYILYPLERLHELTSKAVIESLYLEKIFFILIGKSRKYFIASLTKYETNFCKLNAINI